MNLFLSIYDHIYIFISIHSIYLFMVDYLLNVQYHATHPIYFSGNLL